MVEDEGFEPPMNCPKNSWHTTCLILNILGKMSHEFISPSVYYFESNKQDCSRKPFTSSRQFFIADLGRVIADLHRLDMATATGRYLFIGGVFYSAVGVAAYDVVYPLQFFKG